MNAPLQSDSNKEPAPVAEQALQKRTRGPIALTMKSALNRAARGNGSVVWHLENPERNHRLPGSAWCSRELALADERLPDFPGYEPVPYLLSRATEHRWKTGPGRAGGEVRVGYPVFCLTPIFGSASPLKADAQ